MNTMNTTSDTPRTDASACDIMGDQLRWVAVGFARTLERELAEARKDSERLDKLEHVLKLHTEVAAFSIHLRITIGPPLADIPDLGVGKTLRDAIDAIKP